MATIKFTLILAAIAAVVLVIQSLVVWSRGGKSAVGDLLERFGMAEKARVVVNALGKAVKWIAVVALAAGKAWLKFAGAVLGVYAAIWKQFGPALKAIGASIISMFRSLWPVIVAAATSIRASLIELIAALGKLWQEVRPALASLSVELGNLWVAAKPALTAIWGVFSKVLGILFKLYMIVIPIVGKVIATVFKAAAIWVRGFIKVLTTVVGIVTFIAAKLREAFNFMLALMGRQMVGVGGVGAAVGAGARVAKAEERLVRQSLAINELAVHVSGTADMTQAEFAAAVEIGTSKAFQGAINDAFSGMRSLVPG